MAIDPTSATEMKVALSHIRILWKSYKLKMMSGIYLTRLCQKMMIRQDRLETAYNVHDEHIKRWVGLVLLWFFKPKMLCYMNIWLNLKGYVSWMWTCIFWVFGINIHLVVYGFEYVYCIKCPCPFAKTIYSGGKWPIGRFMALLATLTISHLYSSLSQNLKGNFWCISFVFIKISIYVKEDL